MIIEEGKVKISVSEQSKISKKLPVFYNPVMKLNRDISVLLLNSIQKEGMKIALPLAGSGVRGVRFLSELEKNKIKHIFFNDANPNAIKSIKESIKLNKIKTSTVTITKNDANKFLLEDMYDYVDVDPFGSPNLFLHNTILHLRREGILAVTATDTSALCGTYLNACRRKYWAEPLRNELKHEIGLRILIRKVQLIGAQLENALMPILSYSKDHYMRIFFHCHQGKQKVDELLKLHKFFLYCSHCLDRKVSRNNYGVCDCGHTYQVAGPLWSGPLHYASLVQKMIKKNKDKETNKFLELLFEETKTDGIGFFDMHTIAKTYKMDPPRREELLEKLNKNNIATRTHFLPTGIRTNITIKEIIKIILMHGAHQ